MARSYAKLLTTLSSDDDFLDLTMAAQRLYLMMLANPKMSAAGCLPWQPSRWANQARDASMEVIDVALTELVERRFVVRDPRTEEVLIRSFIRHDGGFKNPNMRKAIDASVRAIESPKLREVAAAELAKVSPPPEPEGRSEWHPEGRSEHRSERDTERASESTYILNPESFNLNPSSGAVLADATDPESPTPNPDDDGVIEQIIKRVSARRAEKARPDNLKTYTASVVGNMHRNERGAIAAMLVAKPHMRATAERAAKWYEDHWRHEYASRQRSA